MMQRIEYRTMDKSTWGPGPWQDEPDKIQWQDAATGYPCLIVRNHASMGFLCGYVGVPKEHPAHGKSYDGTPYDGERIADINVHGGLTFAGGCSSHTREDWLKMAQRVNSPKAKAEAKMYPQGDTARLVADWSEAARDYTKYQERCEAVKICHKPAPGEPDDVWWFGFDCGHSFDHAPGMTEFRKQHGFEHHGDDVYRDVAYVTKEVESLARQLKAMEEK